MAAWGAGWGEKSPWSPRQTQICNYVQARRHVPCLSGPSSCPAAFFLLAGVRGGGRREGGQPRRSSIFLFWHHSPTSFAFVSPVCSSAPLHDCLHVSPPCFSVVLSFPFPPSPLPVSSFSASRHLPPSLVLMVSNGFGGRPASTCHSPRAKMLL